MTEAKALEMLVQVETLTKSHNNLVETIERMGGEALTGRVDEIGAVLAAMKDALVAKGVVAEAELLTAVQNAQLGAMGLVDTGKPAADGDILLIHFKLTVDGSVVEDETAAVGVAPSAYPLGTNRLGCDAGLVGILPGETRVLDTVIQPGYKKHPELVGKPASVEVACSRVMIKTVPPATAG